jgi:hypothetical protein
MNTAIFYFPLFLILKDEHTLCISKKVLDFIAPPDITYINICNNGGLKKNLATFHNINPRLLDKGSCAGILSKQ